ncbi:2-aminoethylphosphonate--pyruvate transaminase [Rhizobium rhizogenes]|uniref:2-aminoethylphosphonate--pyruvate transaminase n=1 Tax=Rhizobium rhizogenes (strain K84 / ATCC BAA-868) TaxID=311403 RepID=B9JNZ5_RHIR8|nr:2-aminoethylphosphonate--pyruvate transaminase [Rhizobium rhizogenes K84]
MVESYYGDPLLLCPGPLSTRREVRQAMERDFGSRDEAFIALTRRVQDRLLQVANAAQTHAAIPLQGSGTFAVEAALSSLLGPNDHLLILENGAYGRRIETVAARLGIQRTVLRVAENEPLDPAELSKELKRDTTITRIAFVHCETSSGILNPLEAIADVATRHGKSLIVDAMSSFGALPIDLTKLRIEALISSANKCLEGVPGLSFVLVDRNAIPSMEGRCPSLVLDLYAQWAGFEADGQWRFTPPVQVVAALDRALDFLEEEGGPAGRLKRYTANRDLLVVGMERLGFTPFLDPSCQSPIIASFIPPQINGFRLADFHAQLRKRGFVIYPGKLTAIDSLRVGCIGHVRQEDIRNFLCAAEDCLVAVPLSHPVEGVN